MQLYGPIPIFPLYGIPFNPVPSAIVSKLLQLENDES
jgi:hypothetical protein